MSDHRSAAFPRLFGPAWVPLLLAGLTLLTNGIFFFVTRDAVGRWFLPLDDAFIYVQYAERIVDLRPFSYRPGGGFSTGATSPLYPFLLAPFAAFLSPETMVWPLLAFSFLWKFLTAWGAFAAGCLLGRHRAPGLLAGVLVCVSGPLTYGFMNGMETGLLAASAVWSLVAVTRLLRAPQAPLRISAMLALAAVLAVLSLMRPEAALVPSGLLVASFFHRAPKGYRLAIILSLVPGLAYAALVVVMTGHAGTSTSAGKLLSVLPFQSKVEMAARAGFAADRVGRLRLAGELALPPLTIFGLLLGLAGNRRRPLLLPVLFLVPLLAPFLAVDPLLHDGRYFVGWVPVALVLWSVGAWMLVGWVRGRRRRQALSAALALAALIPVGASLAAKSREFSHLANEMHRMHVPAARWMKDNLPESSIVAIHDAGILTAFSDRLIVDLNGLVTPQLTALSGSGPGSIWEGLEAFPFHEFPTHLASFPAFTAPEMAGTPLAEFQVEGNVWANGTPLRVWSMSLPWLTLPLWPATPLQPGWRVVDVLDHGDRASERAHDYETSRRGAWDDPIPARLRHLPETPDSFFALTEGGRVTTGRERFTLRREPNLSTRLILRTWAGEAMTLRVTADGQGYDVPLSALPETFQEVAVDLAPSSSTTVALEVTPLRQGFPIPQEMELYHAWLAQPVEVDNALARQQADAARAAEEHFLFAERAFLDQYGWNHGGWLPIDERYRVFWHRGWDTELSWGKPTGYRWIIGRRAGVAIPVREVTGPVTVEIVAQAMGTEGKALPNRLTPVVNGVPLEPVEFGTEIDQTIRFTIPYDEGAPLLQSGLNRVVLAFDQSYPPSVLNPEWGDDDRELVMAVYTMHIRGAGWRIDEEPPTGE